MSGTVAADDLIFEDPTWEAALEEELPPTVSVREVHQLNVLRRQGVFDRCVSLLSLDFKLLISGG